jgi:predicted nucleic acid-binding protein
LELADTSAWTSRHKDPGVEADFDARIVAGEIATCPQVVMELLWTARSPLEFEELREDLGALPQLPIDGLTWARAVDVWHLLVNSGRHRQAKPADLLVAAAGEIAGLPVCHYDADFDAIATVTGQEVRAIAPLRSL